MREPRGPVMDIDPDRLDDLTDSEFSRLIASRLAERPTNDKLWRALVAPDIIDRTDDCLVEIVSNLSRSVQRGRLGEDARARKERTLRRARRRLGQVGAAMHGQLGPDLVRALAEAIDTHRVAWAEVDVEPEPQDLALWQVLDDLRLPDGTTLAEMLHAGAWSGERR